MLVLWDYMQEGIVEYEYFLGEYRSAQAPEAGHAERLACSHDWEHGAGTALLCVLLISSTASYSC